MISFLLNNQLIKTAHSESMTLLDFIRYEENQRGTKIGCREGDCGACTVLSGSLLSSGKMMYQSVTSCLTPLGNVHGKHVVTVEGLWVDGLNRVQRAMVENSGTQCGFCTPGFVVSLCGFALNTGDSSVENAISSIDGNICRCTGYKSIERAATEISAQLAGKDAENDLEWLVNHHFVPDYFLTVAARIAAIPKREAPAGSITVGGGTDLYVQKHDDLHDVPLRLVGSLKREETVSIHAKKCVVLGSATVTDLLENQSLINAIPGWYGFLKRVSSTPIRNIATVAGNLVNASPIGDLTILFLALNAELTFTNAHGIIRKIPLHQFYKGYKTLDKSPDELVVSLQFDLPDETHRFNFEKVCKREYLDIASVNSASKITVLEGIITDIHLSIGGTGPVPLYLNKTREFLLNKPLSYESLLAATPVMQSELAPISDARGTVEYKRLLARNLFFGHFLTLFPEVFQMEELV